MSGCSSAPLTLTPAVDMVPAAPGRTSRWSGPGGDVIDDLPQADVQS